MRRYLFRLLLAVAAVVAAPALLPVEAAAQGIITPPTPSRPAHKPTPKPKPKPRPKAKPSAAPAKDDASRRALASKLNATLLNCSRWQRTEVVNGKASSSMGITVMFNIAANPIAEKGERTFYVRVTDSDGNLLGTKGQFNINGNEMNYTAFKHIAYEGAELRESIECELTKQYQGVATIEIFVDGYLLFSRQVNL